MPEILKVGIRRFPRAERAGMNPLVLIDQVESEPGISVWHRHLDVIEQDHAEICGSCHSISILPLPAFGREAAIMT